MTLCVLATCLLPCGAVASVEELASSSALPAFSPWSPGLASGQAQQPSEATLETFSTFSASSPDALLILNGDDVIVCWNEAASHIFGYPREEMMGKHFPSLQIIPELQAVLAKKGCYSGDLCETTARCGDGRELRVQLSVGKVPFEGGAYSLIRFTDISERHAHLREVEESETQLADLIDNYPDSICITSSHGEAIYHNRAHKKLFGRSLQELNETSYQDMIHPDDFERVSLAFSYPGSFEARVKTKSGNYRHAEITIKHIAFNGSPAMINIYRDVTERKMLMDQVFKSRKQLQDLIDHGLNPICIVTATGGIMYRNDAFRKCFGKISRKGRKRLQDLAVFEDRLMVSNKLHDAGTYEARFLSEEGDVLHSQILCSPITYTNQPAFIHSIRDVSEIVRAKNVVKHVFGRIVTPNIAEALLAMHEHPDTLASGQRKEVTILFCDINHFSDIGAQFTPTTVVLVAAGGSVVWWLFAFERPGMFAISFFA